MDLHVRPPHTRSIHSSLGPRQPDGIGSIHRTRDIQTLSRKGDRMNNQLLNKPATNLVSESRAHRMPPRRPRQRITVFLPIPLIERLRNAVYWTGHRPLAQIIAEAIDDVVSEMEQDNGGVFPQRLSALKPGRPRRVRQPAPAAPSLHVVPEGTQAPHGRLPSVDPEVQL